MGRNRKRKSSIVDESADGSKAEEPTKSQAKRRASDHKMPLDIDRPVKAAECPKPTRQGSDTPIDKGSNPKNHQIRDWRGNFGGNQSPAQSHTTSRKFDKNDKQEDRTSSTTAKARNIRPTKSAFASNRSTSYTAPLPLLAETSKPNRGQSGPMPLTEANLRNLLRSQQGGYGQHHEQIQRPRTIPSECQSSVSAPPTAAATTTGAKFRPSSPMRKSKSPKKSDKIKEKKKVKHDPDTHPLNLPPDQLRQLTAQMARQEAEANRESMSVERDLPETNNESSVPNGSSPPATPSQDTPGAFPEDTTNGTTNGYEERSPTPPPHKEPPPPVVDPEACKAAGNKFFKAKDYEKAIAEYTKGMFDTSNPRDPG